MRVELIAHTPEPERVAAFSAMLSHSRKDKENLWKEAALEKGREILRKVMEMGHLSVIEHISFTFYVEGISRVCSHQLVRHRIASYTQESQRFVEVRDIVVPPSIENKEQLRKKLIELFSIYKEVTTKGNVPLEDARYLLPQASSTRLVVTMNARSLLNFFRLRCCLKAQWEIRNLACEMLRLVKKVAPTIFEKAGPPCVEGIDKCPEKDFDCPVKRGELGFGAPHEQ